MGVVPYRLFRITKFIFRQIIVVALIAPFGVNAQTEHGYAICVSRNLLPSLPPGVPDKVVTTATFGSYRLRESTGTLNFTNVFQRKVLAVEASVEYRDENDHSVAVIPFVASTLETRTTFHRTISAELINDLDQGLSPGRTKHLNGENFVVLRTCPTRAAVGYLHVLFADGHTSEWESTGWTTDPVIKEIPLTVGFSCESDSPSIRLNLRARIGADGKVSSLQLVRPPEWQCLNSLRKSFEGWVFYPALRGGHPSDSVLNILLRLLPASPRDMHEYDLNDLEDSLDPSAIVDFVHAAKGTDNWVVVYGPQPFGMLD